MKLLIALDIDGTLIDTRPSFTRIVKELSGATDAEIWRLRDTGGFNDDWDLSRALKAWIVAGRPDIADPRDVDDLLHAVGARFDPGDMAPQGIALYRSGYWRDERALVAGPVLHALAARHRVAACTGRDLWEFARAEEQLAFTFASRTTSEDVRKPDPHALLRLARDDDDVIVLMGDTAADRQCAARARALSGRDVRFVLVRHDAPVQPLLEKLAVASDPLSLLQRVPEDV
jgi:phosphoglycolate phosphatase-like HAD superfamily hydrolase